MSRSYRVALAGNPNCGKSTIFNELTGARQHVGNWPGKTVEKKAGVFQRNGVSIELVDLPGTYSLSAYSPEEVIARDYILDDRPDAVIVVLDAANLERNLYLAVQVLELGVPVVVTLNMSDIAASRGIWIDADKLSRALRSPVVRTTASRGDGIEDIVQAVLTLIHNALPGAAEGRPAKEGDNPMSAHELAYSRRQDFMIDYGREVEEEIVRLQNEIDVRPALRQHLPSRWLAIKLLEQDAAVIERLRGVDGGAALIALAEKSVSHLVQVYGDDVDTLIADRRYRWINGLVREAVRRDSLDRLTLSDRIDKIVTHRALGIPIFLVLMWAVFKFTSDVAAPMVDWVDGVISGPLTGWAIALLTVAGLNGSWVESLVVDGVIAGVGGVMVFVPVLMFLYMALAVLEDSGYMARAAFVMDRLMHLLGLHGKSFLPLLVGFGCTVPAVYATRTLENPKDRILTGLLAPFMSCSARLPVYVLFATIFFSRNAGLIVFVLYALGIVTAIVLGMLMKRTLFRTKDQAPFVMELPPYRLPTFKGIWLSVWERTGSFVRKAWTIILATSIVIWLLLSIPAAPGDTFAEVDVSDSAFASVAGAIAPAFQPLGFGSWESSGAILTGFLAKEVVVSTLSQVYNVVEEEPADDAAKASTTFFEDLGAILSSFVQAVIDTIRSLPLLVGVNTFEPEEEPEPTALMAPIQQSFEATSGGHAALAALAFMVFVLIYTPCVAAVAALRHELGTRWMFFSVIVQLALAWLMAFVVFQGGRLLGLG
ncbi:MAG: ferrous iron transport protein B [Candidatus Roseilinea sp.]|uniref:ferrous iron transport protein B n=1 Tax=Candidatus Roseilinea sp. TaxID=2838777 RepID=UPI00404ABFAA